MVTHPVPDLRIFLGIGSGCGSVGAHGAFTGGFAVSSGVSSTAGIYAFVPPILRSMLTAACICMVSVMWL